MVARLAAFVIWAALAASAVFWGMRLTSRPTPVPAHAAVVSPAAAYQGDLGRLLGADPPSQVPVQAVVAAAPEAARFKLIGVVAPRTPAARGEALALIAFDDKPPKPYRIGAAVDGDLVLQSVHARGATLGPRGAPAQVTLELPDMPAPTAAAQPTPPSATLPLRGGVMPPPGRLMMPRVPTETPLVEQIPADQQRGDGSDAPERPPTNAPPGMAGRNRPPV